MNHTLRARPLRVAVLDDYLGVSQRLADWSVLEGVFAIDVIDRPLGSLEEAAEVLRPYEVLCHLRERTAMPSDLIRRLPNLRFMTVTGKAHRTLDLDAATAQGVLVAHACAHNVPSQGTPELVWGLLLALARDLPGEDRRVRSGQWQTRLGVELKGKTLGILGLGALGQQVARYAQAFGMKVIAWSPNLTAETARAHGAVRVDREQLFAESDFLTIHVVLSDRSRGLVGRAELARMKPGAYLINTARGPIVDQEALVDALIHRRIAGAALDVFEQEPLTAGHPLTALDNVILTPHIGYATQDTFRRFYEGTVAALQAYGQGNPLRLLNPQVLDGTPS